MISELNHQWLPREWQSTAHSAVFAGYEKEWNDDDESGQ
jgi:hypothetical protein